MCICVKVETDICNEILKSVNIEMCKGKMEYFFVRYCLLPLQSRMEVQSEGFTFNQRQRWISKGCIFSCHPRALGLPPPDPLAVRLATDPAPGQFVLDVVVEEGGGGSVSPGAGNDWIN